MTVNGHQGSTTADLYLRLSDFRADDADSFGAREATLRTRAAGLGWAVGRVVIENDVAADGRRKPASAYKRRGGRVWRPGWRSVLADLGTGAATAVLAEDLDRVARDPRDIEDLIDAVAACGGHARSLSGSLTLTDGGTSDQVTMARVMVTMASKSSADTARRVADGRERSALAGSYGGGRRPFGYRADPDAPKGAKTLLTVPAEAAVIRRAAAAILAETGDDRKSLAYLARELRDGDVPTVTGAAWSAEILRDVMIKPSLAGITVNTRTGTGTAGAWGILPRETWEACRAVLTDPARRTNPNGNAPKWLGSGLYRCGACDDGTSVSVHGGRDRRTPAYACQAKAHLRRMAAAADDYVGQVIAARLALPDARDLLRPPARPGVDTAALRAEQVKVERGLSRAGRLVASDDMTEAEYRRDTRDARTRLIEIAGQLSAATVPDPLAEFRDAPGSQAVWKALPLARKRDVLATLATVTLLPATRRGRGFDPDSVRVTPRSGS